MLRDLLISIGGMIVLVTIWTVAQIFVRRQLPEPPEDSDVLARGACSDSSSCQCGITSGLSIDRVVDQKSTRAR